MATGLQRRPSGAVRIHELDDLGLAVAQDEWRGAEAGRAFDAETEPLIEHKGKFHPLHERQRLAWLSLFRIVAVFAGWQAGKTEIGPWWLIREMQRRGAGDYGLLSPTERLLLTKALPLLLRALRTAIGADGFRKSKYSIVLNELGKARLFGPAGDAGSWGETKIILFHAQDVSAVESATLKGLWIEEPGFIADEIWEGVQPRCAAEEGRILLTGRPVKHNWYVREIWLRAMDKRHKRRADADPEIEVVNFWSLHNPGFPRAEWAKQEGRLQAWRFDMKYKGIPTRPAGAIFEEYSLVPRILVRDEWPRAAGHDFGSVNTAGVWAFRHPVNRSKEGRPQWVIYASYLPQEKFTTDERVEHFLYGYNAQTRVCHKDDPGLWQCGKKRTRRDGAECFEPVRPIAWGGNLVDDEGWRNDFTNKGYPILEPPTNSVDLGIERVQALLKTEEVVIFDDLANLIADLDSYTYKTDEEGEVELDAGGRPIIEDKQKKHRMDCLRSLCLGISELGDGGYEPVVLRSNSYGKEEGTDGDGGADGGLGRAPGGGAAADLRGVHHQGLGEPSGLGHGAARGGRRAMARKERASARDA